MNRRTFIAGLSSAAWPMTTQAQQGERIRRVGVLMGWNENDLAAKRWLSSFFQGLAELGWMEGRNMRVDVRWAGDNTDPGIFARELVSLQPDVILSNNTPETAALQHATRTIPIVFLFVSDPVGSGFVAGLPRPGGNLTGFMLQESSMASKLLELLTEIAPGIKRAALMFNPQTAPYTETYYVPVFETAAQALKVAPIIAPVHDDAEIEAVIASLGREPRGGLVGAPDQFIAVRRTTIISLAARHKVPAIYGVAGVTSDGGLSFYGPDYADQFHRAAAYVDRILRGANPADLPVQLPTKFVLGLNAKTATALGLTVPPSILLRADEVIE